MNEINDVKNRKKVKKISQILLCKALQTHFCPLHQKYLFHYKLNYSSCRSKNWQLCIFTLTQIRVQPAWCALVFASMCSCMSTLEDFRGHGLVDELRSSVHQSHGSIEVIVHHSDVKGCLSQGTWRRGLHLHRSEQTHQKGNNVGFKLLIQAYLSQKYLWTNSLAVSWCNRRCRF